MAQHRSRLGARMLDHQTPYPDGFEMQLSAMPGQTVSTNGVFPISLHLRRIEIIPSTTSAWHSHAIVRFFILDGIVRDSQGHLHSHVTYVSGSPPVPISDFFPGPHRRSSNLHVNEGVGVGITITNPDSLQRRFRLRFSGYEQGPISLPIAIH